MENSLSQINLQIEDIYTATYKAILNINDIHAGQKLKPMASTITSLLKNKRQATKALIMYMTQEKDEIETSLSVFSQVIGNIDSEIAKEATNKIKNRNALNELITNMKWDALKKSITGKKINYSSLIPMFSIIFSVAYKEEDAIAMLKHKNIGELINIKTITFGNGIFEEIKPYFDVIKNDDEMLNTISAINLHIKYQYDLQKKCALLENDKLRNTNQYMCKDLQLKVLNNLIALHKIQLDEDSILLSEKLDGLIKQYNDSINRDAKTEDNVGIYYNKLMTSIIMDRSHLVPKIIPHVEIAEAPSIPIVAIEHQDNPVPKQKGFLKFFKCC